MEDRGDIQILTDDLVAKGVFPPDGLSKEMGEADEKFAAKVVEQLNKHNLNPDDETFYLCDTGIGHGIRIAKELQRMGISTKVEIDKPTMGGVSIVRYQRSIERWGEPEEIDNPRGEMIVIDGHASIHEKSAQPVIDRLPGSDLLKTKGVKRVVLLAEASLGGSLHSKDSYYFKSDLPVIKYLNGLNNTGIEIFAVGIDPRLGN